MYGIPNIADFTKTGPVWMSFQNLRRICDKDFDSSAWRHPRIAGRPLLLTYICLFHNETLNLPANRSALYEETLKILLEKWAAQKRVHNDPICRGLTTKWEIVLLEQLGGPAFEEDKVFFDKKWLVEEIDLFMRNDLNGPVLDSQNILDAIELQQGILVQRARNIYSFSHLTLQEYLAAQYFLSTGKTDSLIAEHFFDQRWREVFLLLVQIARADNCLRQMAKTVAQSIQSYKKLCDLLMWVARNYKASLFRENQAERSAGRRATALVFLRMFASIDSVKEQESYFNSALRFAQIVGEGLHLNELFEDTCILSTTDKSTFKPAFGLEMIKRLRKAHIFKDDLLDTAQKRVERIKFYISPDSDAAFAQSQRSFFGHVANGKQFIEAFLMAIDFPLELTNWTEAEVKALGTYFYGCSFLMKCKNEALSVSREVWTNIADTLVTVQKSD